MSPRHTPLDANQKTSINMSHPPPMMMAHNCTTCGCMSFADDHNASNRRSPTANNTTMTAPAPMARNHMFIAAWGAARDFISCCWVT